MNVDMNVNVLFVSPEYLHPLQLGLPVMCLIIFFAFHLRRVKIFG